MFVLFLFCRDKLVGEGEVPGSETKVHIFFFFYPMTINYALLFYPLSSSIFFVHCRVLQIGPFGGTQNGVLSSNHVALIMAGMERMMTCPREYLSELASSYFSSCTRVPN